MNITEKIAYIKGLAEGLGLDASKPEVKVINAIVDLLDDIAYDLTDMEELYDDLSEQVDEIDQDLAEVESELYDDECECDDDECCCEDDDDDFDFDDEEEEFYEVTCGACGQKLNVSEDVLLEGEIERRRNRISFTKKYLSYSIYEGCFFALQTQTPTAKNAQGCVDSSQHRRDLRLSGLRI